MGPGGWWRKRKRALPGAAGDVHNFTPTAGQGATVVEERTAAKEGRICQGGWVDWAAVNAVGCGYQCHTAVTRIPSPTTGNRTQRR